MQFKKRKNKLTKDAVFYIYMLVSLAFWLVFYRAILPYREVVFPNVFDNSLVFVMVSEIFKIGITIVFIVVTDEEDTLENKEVTVTGIFNSMLFGLICYNFAILALLLLTMPGKDDKFEFYEDED